MSEKLKVKSKSGSTHYDVDFDNHLKIIGGNLCCLNDHGMWMRSAHRLGVNAIDYEKAIIETVND